MDHGNGGAHHGLINAQQYEQLRLGPIAADCGSRLTLTRAVDGQELQNGNTLDTYGYRWRRNEEALIIVTINS